MWRISSQRDTAAGNTINSFLMTLHQFTPVLLVRWQVLWPGLRFATQSIARRGGVVDGTEVWESAEADGPPELVPLRVVCAYMPWMHQSGVLVNTEACNPVQTDNKHLKAKLKMSIPCPLEDESVPGRIIPCLPLLITNFFHFEWFFSCPEHEMSFQ